MRNSKTGMSVGPVRGEFGCPMFKGKACMTKSQAKSTAKQDQRRTGLLIEAFKCRTCGSWHVGGRRRSVKGRYA